MQKTFNESTIPFGVSNAGKPEVDYLCFHAAQVTKKKVKGIPGMDLTIKATVNSPRTSREVRKSVNGSFGKENLLSSEYNL